MVCATGNSASYEIEYATSIKSLYVGFNRGYLNPFLEMAQRVLGNVTELDFFGPGFSTDEELATGLAHWMEKRGPYHFLVTDPYVFEYEQIVKREKPFFNDALRFPESQYKKYGPDFRRCFMTYTGTKILIGHWDMYSFKEEVVEDLVKSGTYVLGFDESLSAPLKALPGNGAVLLPGANDNWFEFVSKFKHRLISFPHFIHSMEFDYTPLHSRNTVFHVPGVGYAERKKAKQLLDHSQRIRDKINSIQKVYRLYFTQSLDQRALDKLQKEYATGIVNSKVCYSSGSSVRCCVRKYFEIPAKGALLLCQACSGFENLGFRDGVNCIVAEDNKAIKEALAAYNDETHQPIAAAGRSMVWRNHSEFARSGQLSTALNLILHEEFFGSYWDHGAYRFRNKSE